MLFNRSSHFILYLKGVCTLLPISPYFSHPAPRKLHFLFSSTSPWVWLFFVSISVILVVLFLISLSIINNLCLGIFFVQSACLFVKLRFIICQRLISGTNIYYHTVCILFAPPIDCFHFLFNCSFLINKYFFTSPFHSYLIFYLIYNSFLFIIDILLCYMCNFLKNLATQCNFSLWA